ncbi:MAG: hypothetical protein WD273_09425 [Trueperaceae bacterium]
MLSFDDLAARHLLTILRGTCLLLTRERHEAESKGIEDSLPGLGIAFPLTGQ